MLQEVQAPLPPRPLAKGEEKALAIAQREATEKGATLRTGGRGGLPPTLVLHVFRRDEYRCKKCGGRQNLTLHHKGGILASLWLKNKGHKNQPNNLVTICGDCHDDIHEQAREDGTEGGRRR